MILVYLKVFYFSFLKAMEGRTSILMASFFLLCSMEEAQQALFLTCEIAQKEITMESTLMFMFQARNRCGSLTKQVFDQVP